MATEKQIIANRKNAQKSTGPRTQSGKDLAKMNAVKHGIMSESLLINKEEGKEDNKLYFQQHNNLIHYFKPQGVMEEVLVEQIAMSLWRKQRVLRFETGCIRKQLDEYSEAYKQNKGATRSKAYSEFEEVEEKVLSLEQDIDFLKEGGDFTSEDEMEYWENSYYQLADQKGFDWKSSEGSPEELLDWFIGQGLSEKQIRKLFIELKREELSEAKQELRELRRRVSLELEQESLTNSLPWSELDLMKIIRYESFLDRQVYKAIGQLERLQRTRGGEQLPLP